MHNQIIEHGKEPPLRMRRGVQVSASDGGEGLLPLHARSSRFMLAHCFHNTTKKRCSFLLENLGGKQTCCFWNERGK
jgi:hypothetical protein